MISYTNEIRLDNGYIYSLDMIRIKYQFGDKTQQFLNWLSTYEMIVDGLEVKHWVSIKEFSYRDLFQIKTDNYSFALAIGFNGCSKDRHNGYIEFNPNKCKGGIFQTIWKNLIDVTVKSEVIRFDLAIDIPLPRYLVKLIKDNRNYTYLSNKGSTTEYLGLRSHAGFIKLYDKTKESKLDYDVTRLEITADLNGINFPEVKILPLQEKIDFVKLSSTERVLIQLLKQIDNPTMYMRQLDKKKRKTIENFIYEETVKLDEAAYNKILKQVLEYQY
jgi:hypothetical protein